jgi:hypothetical protein
VVVRVTLKIKGASSWVDTGGSSAAWVRPADWPALPTVQSTASRAVGLLAVVPGLQAVALMVIVTGGYTVDWGDGSTTNHASGVTAEHSYTYATLGTAVTSGGYKTAIVSVTPQTANHFTFFGFDYRPSVYTNGQATDTKWLDITFSGPACTSLTLFSAGTTMLASSLKQVTILSHSMTTMASRFKNLTALESVPLFNTASVTTMANMFQYCYMLRSVPLFVTTGVTSMANMFDGCYSLESVPLFDTANVLTMSSMFSTCGSLKTMPAFNTSKVTNTSNMFVSCNSLRTVPLFDTSKVTDANSMFSYCYSLESVPAFNMPLNTSMNSMFYGCLALTTVPALNSLLVTNVVSAFQNCKSLRSISMDASSISVAVGTFLSSVYSMNSIILTGMKLTFTVGALTLDATALNALYTSLADIKAYTITNAVGDGSSVVYTTSANHYMVVGQKISVSGITPSGYDCTNLRVTAITSNTFTVAKTDVGAYSSGGSIAAGAAATITTTGNPGATSDTHSLATNKGWTVI